jgi:FG-GAP repeat
MDGAPESGAEFGWALASGDLDHDGLDDLAVGAPGDTVSGKFRAGSVSTIYGHPSLRLWPRASQNLWSQDSPDVVDSAEAGDTYGSSVAIGNFDGFVTDDLAIGVSGEERWQSLLSAARSAWPSVS